MRVRSKRTQPPDFGTERYAWKWIWCKELGVEGSKNPHVWEWRLFGWYWVKQRYTKLRIDERVSEPGYWVDLYWRAPQQDVG